MACRMTRAGERVRVMRARAAAPATASNRRPAGKSPSPNQAGTTGKPQPVASTPRSRSDTPPEEGVDDGLVPLVAALEFVEVVVPGAGALDGPAWRPGAPSRSRLAGARARSGGMPFPSTSTDRRPAELAPRLLVVAEKPWRANARRNREKVLRAAREAFPASGYGVPRDEIAALAGVGPGTVYRHFPSEEELFEAVAAARPAVAGPPHTEPSCCSTKSSTRNCPATPRRWSDSVSDLLP
jgi:hypothetical protein